ncbi:MAG TPA: DUF2231 domain-containing protein [Candidatus Didemnitutus sp.]|nr:DUF2231 domain-containing protein [Candidatus Didemnitutus sp.]
MSFFSDYFGRIHPLLVHFPIALIWIAALAEVRRVWRDSPFLRQSVVWLMGIGAAAAWITAASGWLLSNHEHIRADERITLEWHRWLGLATGLLAGLAWCAAMVSADSSKRQLRHCAVWGAAGLVTATAHLGALIVWGHDWFSS